MEKFFCEECKKMVDPLFVVMDEDGESYETPHVESCWCNICGTKRNDE